MTAFVFDPDAPIPGNRELAAQLFHALEVSGGARSMQWNGRSISFQSIDELMTWLDKFRKQAEAEEAAESDPYNNDGIVTRRVCFGDRRYN